MKLKYYLRGIGIGVVVTTIILAIALNGKTKELSDTEVIARAENLGMTMNSEKADSLKDNTESTEEKSSAVTDSPADDEQKEIPNPETNPEENEGVSPEENAEANPEANPEVNPEANPDANPEVNTDNPAGQNSTLGSEHKKGEIIAFSVEKGQYARQISEHLQAEGFVDDAENFRKYLQSTGKSSDILVGTYNIPWGSTYEEIANILFAPPVENP